MFAIIGNEAKYLKYPNNKGKFLNLLNLKEKNLFIKKLYDSAPITDKGNALSKSIKRILVNKSTIKNLMGNLIQSS